LEATVHDIHSDLIARCRQGEQKAFQDLYKLYSKAMFNIALRITNDRYEAEDVLQEAFVSAFRSLDDFEGRSTFGAWLKRIVINKALSLVTRRKVLQVGLEEGAAEIGEEPQGDPFELELKAGQVRAAISKLSDGYRIVLSLYLLEGYEHKEIAEILGISESTSKTQYLRARHRVKSILREEYYHG
jgi:RNA polymerase sigma factor (sigma-70 family)